MTTFEGSVSVVTGGAAGVGRACAVAFADAGSHVIVADIDEAGGAETVQSIESLGRKTQFIRTDVGVQDDVERLVEEAIGWQGHCDIFMSNAAIAAGGPPHLISVADWDASLRINLWASIWATRTILPHMLERGSGHLVYTSSPAGLRGVPMLAPYVVTKFALNGFAESVAIYCRGKGVAVSVAMPGPPLATRIVKTARVTYDEQDIPDDEMRATADAAWKSIAVPPEDLAAVLVEGIKNESFYIFHSPQTPVTAAERFADLDGWLAQASADLESGGHGGDPLVSSRRTAAKLTT